MRLELPDATIVYDDVGEGEPVVFLHGSLCAEWLTPLARELTGFRRIAIHRAGYGGSEDRTSGVGVPEQAARCAAVLAELGVPRAHWVGHSAGADIALHLAHSRPDLAASLVLLEPALPRADDEPASTAMPAAIAEARTGAWEAAFHTFLTGCAGRTCAVCSRTGSAKRGSPKPSEAAATSSPGNRSRSPTGSSAHSR
ncbi:alpha/beta hydrolase [Streptomyces sp. NPDC021356]|uniref:alpha/beta fold hydrolase n=1 Tax=Streptomyces sp. NPDC021356 TaxID=3154900 RepID=UPI0033FD47AF